jgi:AraC-like DNA-binding protein
MRYFRANYFSESGMPLCAFRVPVQPEHLFHDHDFAELVLVTHGHGWHATRTDAHPIQAGDAFVIQPNEQHSYRDTTGLTLYNVLFDLNQMQLPMFDLARSPGYRAMFALEPRLRSSHGLKSRLKLSPANLAVASDLLAQLERELTRKRAGYQAIAAALFLQTIGFLSRCYSHIEDPGPRALLRLGAVLEHLESSLTEPVQLTALARLAGMSKSSFQRAFRRALNASPVDYLIRLRIQKACELLTASDTTIKEVAAASGFDDSNYFTRQFRRIMQTSPSDFRRKRT